jgi:hypothetical protein
MGNVRQIFANNPQSYPQNLWVRNFRLSANGLRCFDEKLSSYLRQPHDAP